MAWIGLRVRVWSWQALALEGALSSGRCLFCCSTAPFGGHGAAGLGWSTWSCVGAHWGCSAASKEENGACLGVLQGTACASGPGRWRCRDGWMDGSSSLRGRLGPHVWCAVVRSTADLSTVLGATLRHGALVLCSAQLGAGRNPPGEERQRWPWAVAPGRVWCLVPAENALLKLPLPLFSLLPRTPVLPAKHLSTRSSTTIGK